MATSVNKSISGVQRRFTRHSQPSLMNDIPQIVTRNSGTKNSLSELPMETLSADIKNVASNGKPYRSRRIIDHSDTSVHSKVQNFQLHRQDRNKQNPNELGSCNGEDLLLVEPDVIEIEKNREDAKDITDRDFVEDFESSAKEKSRTGKHYKTLVHRLAPTPGFVDKNSLPSDLLSRRRVRRLASLNAAAKVNVFFEPSSPLAGRSMTDIMQNSKKLQGGEDECAEQVTPEKGTKGKGSRPRLMKISKNNSNYLESPDLLSEVAHASFGNMDGENNVNMVNGASLKREQEDALEEVVRKRMKLDKDSRFATIITNRRFEKGKEVIDVGLQVELPLPKNGIQDTMGDTKAIYCSCRSSKMMDVPVQSYVSTYSNGTLVSIPITKTHRLTPQVPGKPLPELTQGDLACRSKRVAGLNSQAMLNAILAQEQKLPSSHNAAKQHKLHNKKSFYEHGLANTVPSTLKIPKINYAATSTSNFSGFGRGKAIGNQPGKMNISGSLWQKYSLASHDGPKRTNGWVFHGTPMVKPYYYSDFTVTRKYYGAINRNNEFIYVRDSVLLKSGPRRKDLPFVARISGFWEEVNGPNAGEMMMSVLWYYRPEQTEMGRQPHIYGENEILASRHKDDNSVACIVDKCYVLSYPEYCRYRAAAKRSQDSRVPSTTLVPPAQPTGSGEQTAPLTANPKLVFFCRQIYDYRMGRIMKNPVIYNPN